MIANSPQHVAAVNTEHRRLKNLVGKIGELCRQPVGDEQFYPQYLQHLMNAMSALGGAIWLKNASGDWRRRWRRPTDPAQRDSGEEDLKRRLSLVRQAAESQGGLSFIDRKTSPEQVVFVAAIRREAATVAVVEVVLAPGSAPSDRQQELALLQMLAGLASGRTMPEVRTPRMEEAGSPPPASNARPMQRLSAFACAVHQSLDLDTTGFLLVNEMRSMLGCDRVTLAVARRDTCRLLAISGQDAIDQRADAVRQLESLASQSMHSDDIWRQRGANDSSPEQSQLDSPWKILGVLPLQHSPGGEVLGVVIIEQMNGDVSQSDLTRRVDLVRPHVVQALANARDHEGIFLRRPLQAISRWKKACSTRRRKLLLWLAAITAMALLVGLFPIPFNVHGRGVLEPSLQRDVFADVDGVVTEVYVKHGDQVQPGDALVKLHNSNLELQLADVLGRRRAVQEHLAAIHRQRHEERLAREATDRLTGQILQLQEQLRGLDQQHALLLEKQNRLIVRSPIAGRVATWNINRRLMLRPVAAGQILLNVADENGPWQLEVYLPESDIGHLELAKNDSDAPLPVDFLAVTEPSQEHRGEVHHVDAHAQLYDDYGQAVRVLVKIDRHDLPDTPAGATVRARVRCGDRSIGYVWLHRLVGFVYTRVLFRLG